VGGEKKRGGEGRGAVRAPGGQTRAMNYTGAWHGRRLVRGNQRARPPVGYSGRRSGPMSSESDGRGLTGLGLRGIDPPASTRRIAQGRSFDRKDHQHARQRTRDEGRRERGRAMGGRKNGRRRRPAGDEKARGGKDGTPTWASRPVEGGEPTTAQRTAS